MSQKSIGEVQGILEDAASEGVISRKALQIIDVNDVVLAGINGMDIDDIQAADVTLLTVFIDDTGSIFDAGLTDAVIEGENLMISSIEKSKQKDNILIAQWKFNVKPEILHSYLPVDQAVRLNKKNYKPQEATAIFDTWVEGLIANVAYAQQLRVMGTPVKNIAVLITDGQDNSSMKYRIQDCKKINTDLLKSEQFVLAFVGMASNPQDETLFRLVAEDMGFPAGAVLTADATPSEIRKVFNLVSQSAIRASQKAISTTAQNSFFAP